MAATVVIPSTIITAHRDEARRAVNIAKLPELLGKA
jgi:hypothetical protein